MVEPGWAQGTPDEIVRLKFMLRDNVVVWRAGRQAPVVPDKMGYVRVRSLRLGFRMRLERVVEVLKRRKRKRLNEPSL